MTSFFQINTINVFNYSFARAKREKEIKISSATMILSSIIKNKIVSSPPPIVFTVEEIKFFAMTLRLTSELLIQSLPDLSHSTLYPLWRSFAPHADVYARSSNLAQILDERDRMPIAKKKSDPLASDRITKQTIDEQPIE